MPQFLVSKLTLWQVWEVWIESAFLEINILHRLEIFRQNKTTQLCNKIIFARPISGLAVSKSEIVTLSQPSNRIIMLVEEETSLEKPRRYPVSTPASCQEDFLIIFWHFFRFDEMCSMALILSGLFRRPKSFSQLRTDMLQSIYIPNYM